MNLSEKINRVRQQPEHIRLRWVWACVGFSMIIIIAIWLFSLSNLFNNKITNQQANDSVDQLKEQLGNLKQQASSIKDYTSGLKQEGVATQNNNSEFDYPAKTNDDSTPQSTNYTDLSSPSTASPQNSEATN